MTAQTGGKIVLRRGDGPEVILLLQNSGHPGGEEGGQGGAETDAPDAQRQQGHQHTDRLLLEPAEDDGEGQLVDRAVKSFGQTQRDPDGTVGILYPFLQKYFVKGVNVGAVKG